MKKLIFLLVLTSVLLIGADYDNIVPSNSETLVFVRTGCHGCEVMKPIVKELINESFNISIVVDLGEHKRFSVTAVPTIIVLVRGKEARRHIGTLSKKEIIAFITKG